MDNYRYVTSNLDLEYMIGDLVIPKKTYTREQLASGKRCILPVTKEQYTTLINNSTFKNMVATKQVNISEKQPIDRMTDAEFAKENSKAVRELEKVKRDFADVKAELEKARLAVADAGGDKLRLIQEELEKTVEHLKISTEAKDTAEAKVAELTEKLAAFGTQEQELENLKKDLQAANEKIEKYRAKLQRREG
jgi:DNA repair exonuclease SbcCD ATPase subunit